MIFPNKPRRWFSTLQLFTCMTLLLMTLYTGSQYASSGTRLTSTKTFNSILPKSKDQVLNAVNGMLSIRQRVVEPTAVNFALLLNVDGAKKIFDSRRRDVVAETRKATTDRSIAKLSAKSIIDQRDRFRVLIHSKHCGKRRNGVNIVTFVHTALENVEDRNEIRETWGSKEFTDSEFSNTVIFVVGNTENAELNEVILSESRESGDLLQSDFEDTYLNLSLKHISWLQWARKNCANVHFFVKVDDDVALNVILLRKLTRSWLRRRINNGTILCTVRRNDSPVRGEGELNSVSWEEYPKATFPPYCSGMAMVYTPDVPRKLFDVTVGVEPLSLEDVFVSGILAQRAALAHINVPGCCIFYMDPEEARPWRPPLFVMTNHSLNHITAWHRRFVSESEGLENSWPEIEY